MPEGHTIHRLARDHHNWFGGSVVSVASPQGRFSEGADRLDGLKFKRATAHGKHLFYEFVDDGTKGLWVHIHLGLFGRFRKRKLPPQTPGQNTRMRLMNDKRCVDLSGPTRCEVLTHRGRKDVVHRLGPDPLLDEFDAEHFIASLSKRRSAIGAILLDQSAVAGIGNVYRSELLFQHRLDPFTPANQLSEDTLAALWDTAVDWLHIGVQTNRIITRFDGGSPRALPKRERLMVYKKRFCIACDEPITVSTQRQRTLYHCPRCQVARI